MNYNPMELFIPKLFHAVAGSRLFNGTWFHNQVPILPVDIFRA